MRSSRTRRWRVGTEEQEHFINFPVKSFRLIGKQKEQGDNRMNSKLKMFEGKSMGRIARECGRINATGRTERGELIILGIRTRSSKSPTRVLALSLHSRLLKMTGWAPGDRIDLFFCEGNGVLTRSTTGNTMTDHKGTGSRKRLCFTVIEDTVFLKGRFSPRAALEVEAEPGRVAFKFPEGMLVE